MASTAFVGWPVELRYQLQSSMDASDNSDKAILQIVLLERVVLESEPAQPLGEPLGAKGDRCRDAVVKCGLPLLKAPSFGGRHPRHAVPCAAVGRQFPELARSSLTEPDLQTLAVSGRLSPEYVYQRTYFRV
eukprot:scaffold41525_cov73-Phaeocystis_antarctica.AAC.5